MHGRYRQDEKARREWPGFLYQPIASRNALQYPLGVIQVVLFQIRLAIEMFNPYIPDKRF